MKTPNGDVTRLLSAWAAGEARALDELIPLVYEELRRIARRHWSGQRAGHTLQPTALINEAFLKLVGQGDKAFESRTQFFALASTAMRQVLVNHAEASVAQKRGGGQTRVSLDAIDPAVQQQAQDVCALHEALIALHQIDPRKSRVVELRYFGGLSIEETAAALSVSEKTVVRDWEFARAWLLRQLDRSSGAFL